MTPTQPTPPGPPPAPPPSPPPGPPPTPGTAQPPGGAPRKSGGTIWMVLFIVAGVLFVGALVFAIIGFTGKNSEADDKEKAQKELASTKRELANTKDELGTQTGAGEILSDLVRTGAQSADDLKACTDAGTELQRQTIAILNARQDGSDVNPLIDGLNAQIDQVRNTCRNSEQSYQAFIDALNEVRNR